MKLFSAIALSSLFATALAQSIQIGYPTQGQQIPSGQNLTVQVDRPDTLTGSTEVAIVIALQSCPSGSCAPPADLLGSILYYGPYDPEFAENNEGPPQQNFSVLIPATIQNGTAQLSVSHFSLVGAGPFPLFQIKNVTVNIV